VDGKPVRDPDELFGGLAVVAFTPDDLALVKGGPEGRRRLLDRAVQNRHPAHLADARDYLRALRSRNQLLRQGAPPALHEAFEDPLARLGARLRLRREQLLDELRGHAARAFAEVARGEEPLQLAYQAAGRDSDGLGAEAALRGEEDLAGRLIAAFRRRFPRDREPLLLLDDVSSELDPQRNAYLMRYLGELQGQVVLTTTDPHLVAAAAGSGPQAAPAVFHAVRQGRVDRSEAP
jgi:DNA replication and repair protein RecF